LNNFYFRILSNFLGALQNNKRGFTLVELIVVLVSLAILASLLVPALTGYMDKTKKQAVISEARDVWTAALTECYALYPESFNDSSNSCRFTITVNGVTYKMWAASQTEH